MLRTLITTAALVGAFLVLAGTAQAADPHSGGSTGQPSQSCQAEPTGPAIPGKRKCPRRLPVRRGLLPGQQLRPLTRNTGLAAREKQRPTKARTQVRGDVVVGDQLGFGEVGLEAFQPSATPLRRPRSPLAQGEIDAIRRVG
jgi:hypothetical protein